jgi:transposase InsO family protein
MRTILDGAEEDVLAYMTFPREHRAKLHGILLPDWIEDYCEVQTHSGLKLRSPREFIRLSA